jgi:hypothetical protein
MEVPFPRFCRATNRELYLAEHSKGLEELDGAFGLAACQPAMNGEQAELTFIDKATLPKTWQPVQQELVQMPYAKGPAWQGCYFQQICWSRIERN